MPFSARWQYALRVTTSNQPDPSCTVTLRPSKITVNSVKQSSAQVASLLVVTRDPSLLRPLWSVAEFNAWHLETANNGWEALERIQSGPIPDLLLLELSDGGGDSLHVLRWARRSFPALPIVVLSHTALRKREAIRLGARDCVIRPFAEDKLVSAIQLQLLTDHDRTQFTSESIEQLIDDTFFLCASPVMQ